MIMGKRIFRIIESVNTRIFNIDEAASTMTIADTTLTALLLLAAKKKSATRNTPINTGTLNIIANMIIFPPFFLLFFLILYIIPQTNDKCQYAENTINGDYHCLMYSLDLSGFDTCKDYDIRGKVDH